MAKLRNGLPGGFSGTIGDLVGYTRNGVNYIRTRPAARKNRVGTKNQQIQRAKFALASSLLKELYPLLKITMKNCGSKTVANFALQYIMQHVVYGEYPYLWLDYSKLVVARGHLVTAPSIACTSTDTETVSFSWTNNSSVANADGNDLVILVAWNEYDKKLFYQAGTGRRSDGSAQLILKGMSGKTVHTWLSFISFSGEVANSVYTGVAIIR